MRFPGFEGQERNPYKKHFFKDVFLFSTGKNIKQDQASPEFEIPCVRYGELYYMYNEVINEVINRTNLDKSELLLSKGDEVLLPSAGEDPLDIGLASALTIENVAIGRTINILRPIMPNIYSQIYVSYYINQKLRNKISTLAKGSSISNVYNSDLKTLEIILPNLDEQTKIASFLSLINARIQTQNKIIEKLETLIKGLCEKLLSKKLRLTEFNSEWEIMDLEKVLIKNSVKNKNQKYSIIQSVSNKHGFINQEKMFEDRRVASIDTSNYYVINKGDFAYNPSRINVGSIAYKKDEETTLISPLYISFRANNDFVNDRYLWYWVKTVEFTRQMNNSFEGSVRNTLSYENLIKINISIPSLEEQIKISELLSFVDAKIQTERSVLERHQSQKRYLLQNLFI